jgi:hypothetical protein
MFGKPTIKLLALLGLLPIQASLALPLQESSIDVDQLQKRIQSLSVADHYWHKISWKKSLQEGLVESSRTHKPVFLWAFIDLPDSERC